MDLLPRAAAALDEPPILAERPSASAECVDKRQRWQAVALSILLHASLAGALLWHAAPPSPERTARQHKLPPTPLVLAIEAEVVAERAMSNGARKPSTPTEKERIEASQELQKAHNIPIPQHRPVQKPRPPDVPSPPVPQEKAGQSEQAASTDADRAAANWRSRIAARIERAWAYPATAGEPVVCKLRITQNTSGEVINVVVDACNGDETVRQSIEAAAYRASPLPAPPDAAAFRPIVSIALRIE